MKGINKRVVMMRTGSASPFETVYFVLRRSAEGYSADLIKEANRIIDENKGAGESARKRIIVAAAMFFGGAIVGASAAMGCCILIF